MIAQATVGTTGACFYLKKPGRLPITSVALTTTIRMAGGTGHRSSFFFFPRETKDIQGRFAD